MSKGCIQRWLVLVATPVVLGGSSGTTSKPPGRSTHNDRAPKRWSMAGIELGDQTIISERLMKLI